MFVVATARVVLAIPGNASLKGKRKVLRRVVDRVRHRYNASIAEIEDLDEHRRAVLGVAVVSNDGRHAQSMLDTVLEFVETASDAPVTDRRTELVPLGSGAHYGAEAELAADWDLEAEERRLARGEGADGGE